MPPPPPPLSLPIYSLSVPYTPTDGHAHAPKTSMNIVTYATAASVAPPKSWTISLYTNTLTHHAFFYGSDMIPNNITTKGKIIQWGILQLLSKHQDVLVDILGKHSGMDKEYDKEIECKKVGYPWILSCINQSDAFVAYHNALPSNAKEPTARESRSIIHVLPSCQVYLLLAYTGQYMSAGDHDVALCQIIDTGIWSTKDVSTDDCRNIEMVGNIQWASSVAAKDHMLQSWVGSIPKDETVVLYTGYLRSNGLL